MHRAALRLWERLFAEPLRKVEAESLAYRFSDAGRRPDWKTAAVLVAAALCLIVQNYTGHPADVAPAARRVAGWLGGPEAEAAVGARFAAWGRDQLSCRVWWCAVAVVTYAVLPALLIRVAFREGLRDYGIKIRGALAAWPVYLLFAAVMVPLVWVCSAGPRFQATYPMFYFSSAEQVRAELWAWELSYAAQFVALEFFFRGFLVHGTKHRFGVYAVFVAVVPYAMIHFGKPYAEATASVVAGVALGFMSLATKSVWMGAALHISVAWGMDLACLGRRGLLD